MEATAPVVPQPVIGPEPGGSGGGTQSPLTTTRISRMAPNGMAPNFQMKDSPERFTGVGDWGTTSRATKVTFRVTFVTAPNLAATVMLTGASSASEIRLGCSTVTLRTVPFTFVIA